MPRVASKAKRESIKQLIFQLPTADFLTLAAEIEERTQTLGMMKLAETAFQEWNEKGEDIYDEAQTR